MPKHAKQYRIERDRFKDQYEAMQRHAQLREKQLTDVLIQRDDARAALQCIGRAVIEGLNK